MSASASPAEDHIEPPSSNEEPYGTEAQAVNLSFVNNEGEVVQVETAANNNTETDNDIPTTGQASEVPAKEDKPPPYSVVPLPLYQSSPERSQTGHELTEANTSAEGEESTSNVRPRPWITWSIVSLLLCLPLGIPAVILSIQVRSDYKHGKYNMARKKSRAAFVLNVIASTIFGLLALSAVVGVGVGVSILVACCNRGRN